MAGGLLFAACSREQELTVDEFTRLSAVLTGLGTSALDAGLARTYLESIKAQPDPALSLTAFYEQAGFRSSDPPSSIGQLAARPLFEQAAARALADKIITYWYTGVYAAPSGLTVATYTDALAWKALTHGHTPTLCYGAVGAWAVAPV